MKKLIALLVGVAFAMSTRRPLPWPRPAPRPTRRPKRRRRTTRRRPTRRRRQEGRGHPEEDQREEAKTEDSMPKDDEEGRREEEVVSAAEAKPVRAPLRGEWCPAARLRDGPQTLDRPVGALSVSRTTVNQALRSVNVAPRGSRRGAPRGPFASRSRWRSPSAPCSRGDSWPPSPGTFRRTPRAAPRATRPGATSPPARSTNRKRPSPSLVWLRESARPPRRRRGRPRTTRAAPRASAAPSVYVHAVSLLTRP